MYTTCLYSLFDLREIVNTVLRREIVNTTYLSIPVPTSMFLYYCVLLMLVNTVYLLVLLLLSELLLLRLLLRRLLLRLLLMLLRRLLRRLVLLLFSRLYIVHCYIGTTYIPRRASE